MLFTHIIDIWKTVFLIGIFSSSSTFNNMCSRESSIFLLRTVLLKIFNFGQGVLLFQGMLNMLDSEMVNDTPIHF